MAKSKKTDVVEGEENKEIDILDQILAQKEYKGLHLGSRSGSEIEKPDIISTGSFFFDQMIGGGFRSSSWSRFYAEPEHGKTAMGLAWAKQWQDFYGEDAFITIFNAEGRISKDLVDRAGVDTSKDRFRIIDTNNADFIYTVIERQVAESDSKKKIFFIVDSTDACQRSIDLGKSFSEADKIGGSATIQSAAGKRLSLIFSRKGHHLYLTSQVRDKVNTHGPGAGGKQASGGNAPKFYSSLTGQIKKHWTDLDILENPSDPKSKKIGRMVNISLEKTYNESTGNIVAFPVKFGHVGGVWKEYEAMMICQAWNYVEKSGAHYSFSEDFLAELKTAGIELEKIKFHGERALREFFDESKALVSYVHKKMRTLIS
jgi:KaiC/GvpD/RAD55 family RecA-like ATPase